MIVLDANIVVEILEQRDRKSAVIAALRGHEGHDNAVTALTLSNVFYILERNKKEITAAEPLLKCYKVLGVASEDADWAFAHYNGTDFEDALQVATAIREHCAAFLTLDVTLAQKYGKFLPIELIR